MGVTVTGRLTLWLCRCLLAMAVLMTGLVATLSAALAGENALTVEGLPGVTVKASVIATDAAALDLPSPTASGWQTLSQPLGDGFGAQAYWVRLVLTVPPPLFNTPMVLRFHPPNARDVKFYLPDGKTISLGTEAPFEQRMLGFADLAASFVPEATSAVITVRLATAGRMFGSFELLSERAYYQSQAWRTAVHGVFYGALLLALLVNIVNWATSRQAIHGLYVAFVGFSLLASLAVNGYLHAVLTTAWSHHSTIQLWAFGGMAATALAFAARMLRLRSWHIGLERAFDLIAMLLLVLVMLASVWGGWRPYVWEAVLAAFIVYGIGSLVASARNWHKNRSVQNTLLAAAFLIFAVSQWVSMGAVFGLLAATPISVGMWQIGLVIHLVLLQVALLINSRQSRWRDWQQQARLDALKTQVDTEARRNRDLQLLLERLTHEFKTPLAVIDSSVQSLEMLQQESDPQRDLRYDRIHRAVNRLNELLMRSVVAEKSNLEQATSQRRLVDLHVLLEVVLAEFTSAEFDCNGDVVIELDSDVPFGQSGQRRLHLTWAKHRPADSFCMEADVGSLHAALYHIFDNAVKYSVSDDDILVAIDRIQSGDSPAKLLISITNVCDTSLIESDLPKLFDKYYRKGERSNVPGAGIGLYVARQAINAHGGKLTARLLKSGLIQFQIELPLFIRDPGSR